MKVEVKRVTDWQRVLNAARKTVHKDSLDKEPSDDFKRKILMSEHSPIRLLEFDVSLKDVPYFVVMHLVRHKHGFEPFVSTSREDRTGVKRADRRQTDLIDCQFSLNAQAFINISRKRLCSCADIETRKTWIAIIDALREVEPILASLCVPECEYRGFCPEINSCGMDKLPSFNSILEVYRNRKLNGNK